MRLTILLLCFATSLYPFGTTLQSFEADFEQHITDDNNQTLIYQGHLWATQANRARWRYTTPILKDIYIQGSTVTMLEPDLEQAIIRPLEQEIDFLAILSQAQKINDTEYQAVYGSQRYHIYLDDAENLKHIRYQDAFENRVELRFKHQKHNGTIAPEVFIVNIPAAFDVIR